jgi:hypothetical protein
MRRSSEAGWISRCTGAERRGMYDRAEQWRGALVLHRSARVGGWLALDTHRRRSFRGRGACSTAFFPYTCRMLLRVGVVFCIVGVLGGFVCTIGFEIQLGWYEFLRREKEKRSDSW